LSSPPTSPALRERYEHRRQEVVAAAAHTFAQRGYHATSIEDLIEATGLTRGGLYHYTQSKQELLFGIFDELMDPLLARARAILAEPGTPEERLRSLVRAWVGHLADHLDHMIVFNQERGTLERDPNWKRLRRARKDFEDLLAGVLAAGRADGSFAIADPQVTLLALLGMVNHTAQWLTPGGRLDAEQIADAYCDLLLGGIRAR
jgi:TetR/AcrR family transcriptional regulator, cholesterol catabolism regulator